MEAHETIPDVAEPLDVAVTPEAAEPPVVVELATEELQAVVAPPVELPPANAVSYESLGAGITSGIAGDLSLVLDVPVELAVEVGRTTMTIRETLAITPGSIISLDRMAGEPVDLLVNGRRIARGEVVAVDEEFGLRITEVVADGRLGDH